MLPLLLTFYQGSVKIVTHQQQEAAIWHLGTTIKLKRGSFTFGSKSTRKSQVQVRGGDVEEMN